MGKTVTVRLDDETYETFSEAARAERRTLSNFIQTAVQAHLAESAFADEEEMAGIRADEELVRRLKRGSRDARTRKGTPVG